MCHCRNQSAVWQNTRLHWLVIRPPPLGQGREATAVRQLFFFFFCIWLDFLSLCWSNSSAFLRFQIFPFSAFLLTPWRRRVRCTGFDVFHLSWVLWGTGKSGGISITWNIYEYFGWQLKGLQTVLDCAENAGMHLPWCMRNQHLPVDASRLYMKRNSLMLQRLRTASEAGLWGVVGSTV